MDTTIDINFNVTQEQKKTIDLRASENGFDDISSYVKVVALKTQAFTPTPAGSSSGEASVELGFKVTQAQKTKIEEKMKESGCEDLVSYLKYVALHAVVTAVVEVRSTGNFDDMLARIAKAKSKS